MIPKANVFKLYLFGSPRLEREGVPFEFSQRKDFALFIYLAVTRQPYQRDSLAALFWPESGARESRASLRRSLHRLHKVLGEELLVLSTDAIGLNPDTDLWLDTKTFQSLVKDCLTTGSRDVHLISDCPVRLAEAVSLYSGDFLAGFSLRDSPQFDEWQFFEGEGLRSSLVQALVQLIHAHQTTGEYDSAIAFARRWLSIDLLHEPAHRQLMELYVLSGQESAALRQYETCKEILQEQLGVEPDLETVELYEQIRRGSREKGIEKDPHRASINLHGFPTYLTPFIGRETELVEIQRLLADPACRLLTLIGPGGIGKTRLAVQTAASLSETGQALFAGGVYFIPMAGLGTVDDIVQATAGVLGLSFSDKVNNPPHKQLLDYIHREKDVLLVLDNFEHLVGETVIRWVLDLLTAAPSIKLLVTSRVWLNLQGEQLFPVGGLGVPEFSQSKDEPSPDEVIRAYSAVGLFVRSAQRSRPEFMLTRQNLPDVIRICRLLQGTSLAVELSAFWIEVLTPAEIAAEIERSLDFLEAEWHDLPERQRSLRAVFESSWQTLSDEERQVLANLSIFQGSITRQAAQQVGKTSLRMLMNLTNKSWLHREPDGRYMAHDLLRQYAREQAQRRPDAWEATRERYSAYYVDFLCEQSEAMKGPRQKEALEAVMRELPNIRATWQHYLERKQFNQMLDMLHGLAYFYQTRAMTVDLYHLLERIPPPTPLEAAQTEYRLLAAAALTIRVWRYYVYIAAEPWLLADIKTAWDLAGDLGNPVQMGIWVIVLAQEYAKLVDLEKGIERLRQYVEDLRGHGDQWMLAFILTSLGTLLRDTAKAEARECLVEALTHFRENLDFINMVETLRLLGTITLELGDTQGALVHLSEGLKLADKAGDLHGKTAILWDLGEVLLEAGEFERAFQTFEKQRAVAAQAGWRVLETWAISVYSYEAVRYLDIETARQKRLECIALSEQFQDTNSISWDHWEMGEIYRVEGDLTNALEWYEKARELFTRHQIKAGLSFYHRGLGDIAQSLGDYAKAGEHFEESLRLAQEFRNRWEVVYALNGSGRAAVGLRQLDLARQRFKQALAAAQNLGNRGLAMVSLTGLAGFYTAEGKAEEAVKLSAFVINHFASWRETRGQAAAILEAAKTLLPEKDVEIAQASGRALDLTAIEAELLA